ncbi:hypothetical protein [Brumimicrobium mesophilum]|uniref:hypothetical protein n=1 Tax=Brumimicrobium mesophilum TaxID=392717 RepID=UPI000D142913|nr:hypothetical protein [Brumimicrobium mesophilum]
MKNTILLCLILLFINFNGTSQEESQTKEYLEYDQGFSAEVFNQGAFGFGIGGIIGKNLGHKSKPNFSMGIYTDVILADSPIFSPRLKFLLNHSGILGLGVNLASNYREGETDLRITPEINFSLFGIVNLCLGYSINVNNNSFTDLSEYRIGVNINFISKK